MSRPHRDKNGFTWLLLCDVVESGRSLPAFLNDIDSSSAEWETEATSKKTAVFSHVRSCSVVNGLRCFEGICCFLLQGMYKNLEVRGRVVVEAKSLKVAGSRPIEVIFFQFT
jgi:hypothetical protein